MKKLFIVAIATLLSYSASAQMSTYDPFFRFGLKAGVNLSNIRGNDLSLGSGGSAFNFEDNSNRALGFAGGVFFRFGRKFYVQPEILLSQKGGTFNVYRDGVTNEEGKLDVRFSNLDVPVMLGGRFGKFFRVNVGPVASLRMTNSGKISDAFNQYTDNEVEETYNNNVTFGYQAGVGFDFGRLSLDVRYEGNLNDVVNINYNNVETANKFGRKSNLFQATLGIAIL
ncbi:porin family protein [Arundinibacter roseus]|nr:porin family protein [Arundinibacter roseus]